MRSMIGAPPPVQPFTDHPKNFPHYDHILPDFLGGENDLENCQVIRVCCHVVKTGLDLKHITKARRGERDRRNIKPRKSHPIPGSKGSGLRKKMNGDVIRVKEKR